MVDKLQILFVSCICHVLHRLQKIQARSQRGF